MIVIIVIYFLFGRDQIAQDNPTRSCNCTCN